MGRETTRGSEQLLVPRDSSRSDLLRCGAEIVELSERFYRGIFTALIVFVGLASVAALALLPLRESTGGGGPPLPGIVAASLLIAVTPIVIRRRASFYRSLRRYPRLELVLVGISAALVSAIHPLHSQLWWPSCALLMLLAVIAPLRRVLFYCLIVLSANLLAHVLSGDLDDTPAVAVIGLWIGYPFWSATVAAVSGQMVAHLLRLNARTVDSPFSARRVDAWTTKQPGDPGSAAGDARQDGATSDEFDGVARTDQRTTATGTTATPSGTAAERGIASLTGRQLQVVALLADGMRYREVAACLSISEGQVQRHVAHAVSRLGVHSVNELVAVAVGAGMVPDIFPSKSSTRTADNHAGHQTTLEKRD